MFFSENLKYLRKYKNGGQSQENLAECLDITRAAIMAYESGRAEPRLEVLNKIAAYFEISLERLINTDLEKDGAFASENHIFKEKIWPVTSSW